MGKQAIGVYALNYRMRMDKTAYVLSYPSRPMTETRFMNIIEMNKVPSGTQVHVAIMSYTGYNQEDSILINKGSVDRGLFMATIYHTEKDEAKSLIHDDIIRCNPNPAKTRSMKFGNYGKINSSGFIPENQQVENRDIIIGKVVPIRENKNDPTKKIKFEDQSRAFRTTEPTFVEKNFTGRNGDGYYVAKVSLRSLRKVVIGDKFSSRSGQKGTCGNLIEEENMPFTSRGLKPDIILNPHAIPSRMTIAQLKETILGKVLLELGLFGDGTSFGNIDMKCIMDGLQQIGYESYGNEIMYDAMTGKQIECSIFIGPVFYQRLKHMVIDKLHSRSNGPMVNLTRQPAEGRCRDGGFRIGEMERDAMIAHGVAKFSEERYYYASDKYHMYICKKCGSIAQYNDGGGGGNNLGNLRGGGGGGNNDGNKKRVAYRDELIVHKCRLCENTVEFSRVNIPYCFKLLMQELLTINISTRIITE